ncbi:E3 UFM1-protein ligase 1-like [Amphiura filiformis]|uniref:E3 UFM1-protein ligase 1-like n=1 Tax=Amphiura filiformis TaxID=82378 RepID=UPI003B219EDB
MASSEWEEVKRLAADFQRAQLTTAQQRLSERNCVEIVNKLLEQSLIDVVYTLDGKEYLTPSQVSKEIRDELIVHGGRINLVDLQQIIGVDFSHVETKANELVKGDGNLYLQLGQLIDSDYLDSLAEEINDKLQDNGQVTMADLIKSYDLPADFITDALESRLGTIIDGEMDQFDRGLIFTKAFVDRHTAKIRGVFSAITKPTLVLSILNQYKFPEKLFYNILEGLVSSGRLCGSISGGRQDRASYVPEIYAKTQNNWVDSFYKQNGYLEYDALSRLGISDAKTYIKRRFKSEKLIYLPSCCIGQGLQDQVEASIEEALASGTWVDILPLLPSILTTADASQILQQFMKGKGRLGAKVFCESIVCSEKFLESCRTMFDSLMKSKAEKDVTNAPQLLMQVDKKAMAAVTGGDNRKEARKDERRKKAAGGGGSSKGGGGGAGSQGREGKTKKVKKGRGRGRDAEEMEDDYEEESSRGHVELEFLPVEEIQEVLEKNLRDCPEGLHEELAEDLFRPLTRVYQEVAKAVYQSMTGTGTAQARRKTRGELQEKMNTLWNNVKLFEKGIKQFDDEDIESQLSKYLVKTLCTDITNLLFCGVASENQLSEMDPADVTAETRAKIVVKLPEEVKNPMSKLHASIAGKDVNEFLSRLDEACDPSICDILLKKIDKKKERQIVFHHRQALCEQLRQESDPAMALHLTVVITFQNATQCMVHAPGKCVPQLISHLAEHISPDQNAILIQYQGLVQKQLGLARKEHEGSDDHGKEEEEDPEMNEINKELRNLLQKVKDVALVKKRTNSAAEQ